MNIAATQMPASNRSNSTAYSRKAKSLFPPLPNLDEVGPFVIPIEFTQKSNQIGVDANVFLRVNEMFEGDQVLLFASDFMLQKFATGHCIFYDGTFKAPKPFQQL
jgi:hypothetical protein